MLQFEFIRNFDDKYYKKYLKMKMKYLKLREYYH